jgi:hypothetical protein
LQAIDDLHPAIRNWFSGRFAAPTPCQIEARPANLEGRHALIAAPTGSGKTLAAFLGRHRSTGALTTGAVVSWRWLDPASAADLGRLDPRPSSACGARPGPRPRAPTSYTTRSLLQAEGQADKGVWPRLFAELRAAGRATVLTAGALRLWVAVEQLPEILALSPEAVTETRVRVLAEYAQVPWDSGRTAARV